MTGDPYTPQSGDVTFGVLHYALDLEYRVLTNRLDGVAVISAVARQPLTSFSLDLVGLRASRVQVDDDKRTRYRQGPRGLVVKPPAPIAAGTAFQVTVRYGGHPVPRHTRWGQLGWEELADGLLVGSQPTGAPTWFPCNDRPSDKARYRIQVSVEDGYTVLATGRPISQTRSSGRVTWVFAEAIPTASYLVALHVGRYRSRPLNLPTVSGTVAYPAPLAARVQADLACLPRMLALFEDRFGPYPMGRYDLVVTSDDLEIPLEAQGMAVFGANHLDGRGSSERLVAHELAHQWFGNSVGVATWQDIWLNEGLSCYAEWLWSEEAGQLSCQQQAKHHRALLARLPQDLVLADPGAARMFDDRVYKRGALALQALRRVVGDATFFGILRGWTDAKRHATGTTADFVALAETVAGRELTSLFTPWLHQAGLPKLPAKSTPG